MDGFDEFINSLRNTNDNVDIELTNLVNRLSNRLLRSVKLKTPVGKVRGGTLRRTWKNSSVDEFERVIQNNTEYGEFVEKGHRIVRNGRVVGYVDGQYMLKRSVEEVDQLIDGELNKTMDRIMGSR